MDGTQKRIDRAWTNSKDWIVEFDGSATETYLTNIALNRLPQAFAALAQQSKNFRVSTVSGEQQDQSEFVSPDSIQSQILQLQEGEIAGISINYMAELDGFDLDAHMVVNTLGKQKVDLEIIWWSDQVFSEEVDNDSRFKSLIGYFLELQDLFGAQKMYIGPETLERPGPGSISWVEV